jgi:hypothetical protein
VVEIRLPGPQLLRSVVVRGLNAGAPSQGSTVHLLLEGSADGGTSWSLLADLGGLSAAPRTPTPTSESNLYREAAIAPGAPAVDRVRLRLPVVGAPPAAGMFIGGLAEVSLFP